MEARETKAATVSPSISREVMGPDAMILVFCLRFKIYLWVPEKVCLVKAMVFPAVMYGCESWTVKKAERRRIDAFELWYWRRLWRVPWTARRSNQSILRNSSNDEFSKCLSE